MARKQYKPEEIVAKLRQVDVLVSQGARELRAGSIGTSCVDHPSQSLADVRFGPRSGQIADDSVCPLSAKSCHMRCSKPLSVMAPNWRRRGGCLF